MNQTEIEQLADALAPRVARLLVAPVADGVYEQLQPNARAVLESQRATAEMTAKALGAVAVREEEGARRKQAMLDAAAGLAADVHRYAAGTDARLDALAAEIRGVTTTLALVRGPPPAPKDAPAAEPPPPDGDDPAHPRTTAAVDELGEEAVTLLTAVIRTGKRAPARVGAWIEWVWTHPAEVQAALKRAGLAAAKISWAWTRTLFIIGGAIGALRVLTPHVPGLEPVAAFLQAVMDAASAFDAGAASADAGAPPEEVP